MPSTTPAPATAFLYFVEDFHWPLPEGSLTFHAFNKIEVDQDVAESAIPALAAVLVEPDWDEPSSAPEDEIEEAE